MHCQVTGTRPRATEKGREARAGAAVVVTENHKTVPKELTKLSAEIMSFKF